ncbi:DNA-binding protein [Vibrio cidicii]|uniref:DNA-binding protein n=1 Tax=Vibrio cidicii TaxID=1763883 RepID=A0ABR5W651_9VIBR|nr:helix-turn-helix transcriptional regulator [Vibrio cidicii]KYN90700.1 DNA-binding protein [Vibrio cidicii]
MNVTGKQIKKLRIERGLTQEQLAARCNVAGLDITRSTLAKVESGVRQVTDTEVQLFAKILKVSEGELFTNE